MRSFCSGRGSDSRCGSYFRFYMTRSASEDMRFRVLRALQDNPELSQREIAGELGVSLGAINYCLKALVDKGQIKIRNFRASDNKLRYAYLLTPHGISEKSHLTAGFLRRKLAEFEALKAEIESIESDLLIDPKKR